MDISDRIERALRAALDPLCAPGAPPRLVAAVYHSVFPAGGRVRPELCIRVAMACDEDQPELTDGVAAAIELLHCASLVHDDLPCFDAATTRRGQPSTHRAFGEPLAVLAGDELIIVAFETLASSAVAAPHRLGRLVKTLGRGVGVPGGIVAGQGWESEPAIPATLYRRMKTGALFEAAAVGGALAAGVGEDTEAWRGFGQRIGEAYQVADDVLDVLSTSANAGKPVGRDEALGRPNVVSDMGLGASTRLFDQLVEAAIDSIPRCAGRDGLCAWTNHMVDRIRRRTHVSYSQTHAHP
ncbi:MAG: polyprenyl synthetase family protein [Polyangiaceae bacterium]|nr:polyprenyl synthetase family protein [Polyangiaceae bacterium]